MKSYNDVIFREGCTALDGEFSGSGGMYPTSEAINLIAYIYGVSKDTVIRDIKIAKDSEEVYLKVAGRPLYPNKYKS